ncbi:MAG TPA: hypothetical protein VJ698_03875 [Noviherbaspirillum sp.]|uniref:hypothetical protein n=1 Tax=Noviherbaspirillum sp. TaxID=1926288 RepID=UPI002B484388|nr:hypothetical protein [Noviherbaspirillum sp.]HJV84590.1 hypothetical protein [Noviherbaspirillum sp.]
MLKSNRYRKAEFAALLVALFAASANSAMAETKWEKTHPRRDQVNDRLARQNHRITHERKEGDLTKDQAVALRKQDNQIRKEERSMAAQNGGHITRAEQRTLNQQENAVSQQIGK